MPWSSKLAPVAEIQEVKGQTDEEFIEGAKDAEAIITTWGGGSVGMRRRMDQGPTIDEAALIEALQGGEIQGFKFQVSGSRSENPESRELRSLKKLCVLRASVVNKIREITT